MGCSWSASGWPSVGWLATRATGRRFSFAAALANAQSLPTATTACASAVYEAFHELIHCESRYTCVADAIIRRDSEIDSESDTRVGVVRRGTTVFVLERAMNSARSERLRIREGWISTISLDATQLLVPTPPRFYCVCCFLLLKVFAVFLALLVLVPGRSEPSFGFDLGVTAAYAIFASVKPTATGRGRWENIIGAVAGAALALFCLFKVTIILKPSGAMDLVQNRMIAGFISGGVTFTVARLGWYGKLTLWTRKPRLAAAESDPVKDGHVFSWGILAPRSWVRCKKVKTHHRAVVVVECPLVGTVTQVTTHPHTASGATDEKTEPQTVVAKVIAPQWV